MTNYYPPFPPDIPRDNLSAPTKAEKEEVLRNDTYLRRAKVNNKLADDTSIVSGSKASSDFPRMPSGSPWSSDWAPNWGPEEQLGTSVEDMPVNGEPIDVEKAQEILNSRAATSQSHQGRDEELVAAQPDDVPMLPSSAGPDSLSGSSPVPTSPFPVSGDAEAVGTSPIPTIRRRKLSV